MNVFRTYEVFKVDSIIQLFWQTTAFGYNVKELFKFVDVLRGGTIYQEFEN